MKNNYGVKLDSNGYAPSIVMAYKDDACFLCDSMGELVRHEIFNGPFRKKSKELGCWVVVCPECHERLHRDADLRLQLKQIGQRYAMVWYDWDEQEFIKEFGKKYD